MRMFAGPNGSGKSTIKAVLPPECLGVNILFFGTGHAWLLAPTIRNFLTFSK